MRVITGLARGRKLETLSGEDVRPTTDKIKEAIFSSIQFQIQGRRFLDLFGGSGQMGIEALSRSASQAVIVDSRKESVEVIKRNLNNTGLTKDARVINMDSIAFLNLKNDPFDIAFLDPPYGSGLLQKALPLVVKIMNKGGTIVCEHPIDEQMEELVGDFVLSKQRRYGKIMISLYNHKDVV